MASFSEQFQAFKVKALAEAERKAKAVLLEVGDRLIDYSPIGKPETWKSAPPPGYEPGKFRGSWHHSMGAPSTSTEETIDITGSSSKARFIEGVMAQPFGVHYFTSNVPYALMLELGNHSKQVGPEGIVGKVVAEFPEIARRIVPEGYGT